MVISKEVMGPHGRKTDVNPTLYALERRGLLIHQQNGNVPIWKLPNKLQ